MASRASAAMQRPSALHADESPPVAASWRRAGASQTEAALALAVRLLGSGVSLWLLKTKTDATTANERRTRRVGKLREAGGAMGTSIIGQGR